MAYSNTISQTVFDTRKVIDNAVRRCRLPAEMITAEYIDIANDMLYLLLSDLANMGAPLWCIEKQIIPLYNGVGDIVLDTKVVDILNSNYRQLQEVDGTKTTTSTTRTVEFESTTFVTTVGIKWSAASVPVALERSNDGIAWTTIQTEDVAAVAGEWVWFDLESSIATLYFRVRATTGVLSFSEVFLGNMPTEIPLARMNKDDYINLPNKTFQSNRTLQFWYDRQIPNPIMHMWPVPNEAAEYAQLVVYVQRYIMDVGTMTQELEVPQRWYEAIVSMLAAKLAMEITEVNPALIPMLDQKAQVALYTAQAEERDNSPMMMAPNISMYTR
jgi:hypothetical protein